MLYTILVEAQRQHTDGIAAALITEVQAEATAQGWGVLCWITRDNNYRARRLYDKLAQKTDWTLYEMTAT